MRLLVIEDDPDIREMLTTALKAATYAVDEAGSATEAEGLATVYPYDGLVVDIGLPEGQDAGLKLIRRLRNDGMKTPVLFLSARAELNDRLAGFDVGGDDYLVKPYSVDEVQARLRALLRRAKPAQSNLLERFDLRVDWNARAVAVAGQPTHLTAKEYAILELLASHPGRIFERDEIIQHVWDASFGGDTNVVDVYVWNLRKKLGAWTVETVRGIGYRFPA
jgi:two-component system response regulator PhoP